MRSLVGTLLAVAIAGCGLTNPVVDLDGPGASGPVPPFEDCIANEYLYIGENTLAALGLDEVTAAPVPAADANRVGMIWVTADFLPFDHREPGGSDIQMVRMFCVEFPDGSGMSSWPVDETWRPPGLAQDMAGGPTRAATRWELVLIALAAMLTIAVSLVAFRRRR